MVKFIWKKVIEKIFHDLIVSHHKTEWVAFEALNYLHTRLLNIYRKCSQILKYQGFFNEPGQRPSNVFSFIKQMRKFSVK